MFLASGSLHPTDTDECTQKGTTCQGVASALLVHKAGKGLEGAGGRALLRRDAGEAPSERVAAEPSADGREKSHSIPDLMYVGIVLSTVLHKKSAMVLQQNYPSKSQGHVVTAGSCTPSPEILPQELEPRAWDSALGTSFPG